MLISTPRANEGEWNPASTRVGWEYLIIKNRELNIWHEKDKQMQRLLPVNLKGSVRFHLTLGGSAIDPWLGEKSIALGWIHNAEIGGMIGYTFGGRPYYSGWGTLKNLVASPGRYTCAEALFLAQQQLLHAQYIYNPALVENECALPVNSSIMSEESKRLRQLTGSEIRPEHIYAMCERDRVAYLGDPRWNVRVAPKEGKSDYTITGKKKKKKYILTIRTGSSFSMKQIQGNHFREDCGEMTAYLNLPTLPLTHLFPVRLRNPRLAKKQPWTAMVDENGIMLYEFDFKPNSTYKIVLKTN